ncbi:flagellar hook-length control protein FliK [uncultured Pigmentiphaga sp.]|uniref:flagellar hook-length control protein FliK n=1 Tax=uncultured Pigmentiphaga sp. TaxID=340361 RepID=UPI002623007D|nr:flagellar hook-length control protein FliK [uncultured Pigmentiphaga sp.]
MVDSRQVQAITGITPVQSWEHYREQAREAILARLLNVSGARQSGGNLPHGLVRATVLQAHSASEALVDIGGKPYLVNTRQPLRAGASVILRLLDDATFLQGMDKAGPRGAGEREARGGRDAGSNVAPATGSKADRPGTASATRGIAPVPLPALAELKTTTGDARIQLSGSARLLFALVSEGGGLQRGVPLASLHIPAGTPPTAAAHQMQQAVEHSGLFYESHLQEWREGRRSLEALRAEPQAAFSPGPQPRPTLDAAVPAPAPQPATTPEQNAAKGLQAALAAIPPDVRPLVQDQIALLASGRLLLEGAWGERPFKLEIEPDAESRHDPDLPLAWRVRVQVETPHLGKLEVDVSLSGIDARVTIRPDTKSLRGQRLREVEAQLTAGGLELQQALDSQGLRMSDLRIAATSRSPARS